MLECMKNRRSIRKYTDQDIPESLLNELLEVATRASNTGNMQLYSVVVTRDPANMQKILGYLDRNGLETLHTSTQIIIAPGYNYKIVKAMVTNFHQPQSTLLLLVSAFVKGNWRTIYDYALAHDFRFLSYGDSSLLIP